MGSNMHEFNGSTNTPSWSLLITRKDACFEKDVAVVKRPLDRLFPINRRLQATMKNPTHNSSILTQPRNESGLHPWPILGFCKSDQ